MYIYIYSFEYNYTIPLDLAKYRVGTFISSNMCYFQGVYFLEGRETATSTIV